MKMRATGITLVSLALTTAVIGNAYYHKKQFYPSVVYITKSNASMAVMYIQAFILVYLTGKCVRKIFFGELRAAEFEHLMERSWYAVTETCLAFTVFRDDFSPKFVALFTLLLFLKSFHWLADDRVDFMERSPIISTLFHVRILSLLILLGALDIVFIDHAYQSTVTKGASVQLVFGFEYAILLTIIVNITIKYVLHTVDLNSETPWDSKAMLLLYTDLLMGGAKVALYLTFVIIMIQLYTLPLFAFRPMYYTMRNFKQAWTDVVLSRRAINNMNNLYPDATPEELSQLDNVCIICREEMTTASKKLPCNHIFHASCLRSWFQRQQTCPTCRLNILRTPQPPAPAPPQRPFPYWQQPPGPPGGPGIPMPGPGGANDPRQGPRFATMPPPFYPPMMGMFPPPPMPPTDFAGLSDEELARMEGETRENIEARLQCLRQIELLLNASATVMQQYLATVQASNVLRRGPPANFVPGSSVPSTSNQTGDNSSANQAHVGIPTSSASSDNQSNVEIPTSSASSSPAAQSSMPSTSASNISSSVGPSSSSTADAPITKASIPNSEVAARDSNSTTQQDEVRRSRLQKFAQE